jgi:hypothetical protein
MQARLPYLYLIVLILLCANILFISTPAGCVENKGYEASLKQPGLYNNAINYLRRERAREQTEGLNPKEFIILFSVDLFFSFFCLWLALVFLTDKRFFPVKSYIWFLFIFNLSWFISLLLLKAAWGILFSLVIVLSPSLRTAIFDGFSLVAVIASVLLYIWLLARTFNLNFFGASETFLISHLGYLVIIFLFFIYFKENKFFNLPAHSMGIGPIIKSYLSDVDKIATGQSIFSLIRFRPYHL